MNNDSSESIKTKKSSIKFPLRVKILSGIFLLLALAIGTILSYSTELILTDKKAYIYETGLQKTASIANTFKTDLDTYLQRIKDVSNKKDLSINDFFNYLGNNVFFFQKIDLLKQSTEKKLNFRFFEQTGIKFKFTFEEYENLDLITLANEKLPKISIKDLTTKTKFPSYGIILHNKSAGVVNIIGIGALSLNSILSSNDKFKNQMLNNSGLPFFSKGKSVFMASLKKQSTNTGTILTKGHDGQELLLSFTKLPMLGLNFLSYIHKKDAFKIATELLVRTLYFGLALLFLFFIFGTLFSISISKPVKLLSQATYKMAEGDFSYKVDVRTKDEFSILGDSFNFMSSEIETLLENKEQMINKLNTANEKLEDYSKNLEVMVGQRTAELNEAHSFLTAMVNSLDQGLVVFDKDVKCNNVFTQAALKLFNNNPEGMSYPSLLGVTDQNEIENITKWADIVFKDLIPFKSSKSLGPRNIVRGRDVNDPEFSHIELSYYPIRDDKNTIQNIVAVATDKTQEVIATENFIKQESYVKMVLKITNNKDHFLTFLDEVNQIMSKTNDLLTSTKSNHEDLSIESLLISFHTLNGGFGLFSVDAIQIKARESEQTLIDMRKQDKSLTEIHKKSLELLMQMEILIDDFKNSCTKVFGKKLSDLYTNKEINITDAEQFYKLLQKDSPPALAKEFKDKFINIRAEKSVQGYSELITSLAKQLKKNINSLVVLDHELTLPPGCYNDFFSSLVHLFRNCMDHGIETEEIRIAQDKSPAGTISIEFKTASDNINDWMIVQVKDDGAGINPETIRKTLTEKYPELDLNSISDKDILYKIFDPEFSTAEASSEVSGRGVGMSAIKEITDKYSGQIEIESKLGVGSLFTFKLPKFS